YNGPEKNDELTTMGSVPNLTIKVVTKEVGGLCEIEHCKIEGPTFVNGVVTVDFPKTDTLNNLLDPHILLSPAVRLSFPEKEWEKLPSGLPVDRQDYKNFVFLGRLFEALFEVSLILNADIQKIYDNIEKQC